MFCSFCLLALVESHRGDAVDGGGDGEALLAELPHNGHRLVALLHLHQLVVALLGDRGLHLLAVGAVLLELLAQLELDLAVLQRGAGLDGVAVAVDDHLHGGAGRLGEVSGHKVDA